MIIEITPTIAMPLRSSLTMLMMCNDSKEMYKKCAVHSKYLFCLLNQFLSLYSCFHHHHCGCAGSLVAIPKITIISGIQQFCRKTNDLIENARLPIERFTSVTA